MKSRSGPHFIFFAGKGGVGKTTCAAAHAVGQARDGRRVLIVSTDPAHSLGDVLGRRLSSRVATVPLRAPGSIRAVEFDAKLAFRRWLHDHRQALGDIIEHGTLLDGADVQSLLGLPVPGIDELTAMLEIVRVGHLRPAPDLVVVDTAPTGHALRLLAAPEAVSALAGALEDLQREHRLIRTRFAGALRPEAADRLITLLAAQAASAGDLLRDGTASEVHWILTPEELSLAETRDGLAALRRASIRTPEVVVNRMLGELSECPICDRRRAAEAAVLERIRASIGKSRVVRVVPAQTTEPRGIAGLARVASWLRAAVPRATRRKGKRQPRFRMMAMSVRRNDDRERMSLASWSARRVVFVGGKGGVGKTTVAATLATLLARGQTTRRVLLFSTDPAHSLGDVFGQKIGDQPRSVKGGPGNLRVRELDASAALAEKRSLLELALAEVASAVGVGSTGGESDVAALLELAPPGIDELFGLLSIAELAAEDPAQTIVVDTAPTGHTLRLLEMPEVAQQWLQVLMRVLLKYRKVMRPGVLAAELVELSRSIREFRGMMADPRRVEFIVVTRAEAVPRLETEDLLKVLRRLQLGTSTVIVNAMTLAAGDCARCGRIQRAEVRELNRLAGAVRRGRMECAIIQAPLAEPPPRGVAALERWASTWIEPPTSTA